MKSVTKTELNDAGVLETPKIETPKPTLLKSVMTKTNDDEYDIIEEHITKKPKKKRIVYREESDSEEEVIIRRKN